MVQVFKVTNDIIKIDDVNAQRHIFVNPTEARQLIADIMAALDEPIKPDVTTQAYQEWIVEPDIRKGDPAFEHNLNQFVYLYKIMMQRGLVR